jgi:hypothetical protein
MNLKENHVLIKNVQKKNAHLTRIAKPIKMVLNVMIILCVHVQMEKIVLIHKQPVHYVFLMFVLNLNVLLILIVNPTLMEMYVMQINNVLAQMEKLIVNILKQLVHYVAIISVQPNNVLMMMSVIIILMDQNVMKYHLCVFVKMQKMIVVMNKLQVQVV